MRVSALLAIFVIIGFASAQLLHYGKLDSFCFTDESKIHVDYYKGGICAPKCHEDTNKCPQDFVNAGDDNAPVPHCYKTGFLGTEGDNCTLVCAGPMVGSQTVRVCPTGAHCNIVSVTQGRKIWGDSFQVGHGICLYPDTPSSQNISIVEE